MATMTKPEMEARIKELEAAAAAGNAAGAVSFKVSKKGAVSVYGLGRWPVTLYQSQWDRLLESGPQIRAFMAENVSLLAVKSTS